MPQARTHTRMAQRGAGAGRETAAGREHSGCRAARTCSTKLSLSMTNAASATCILGPMHVRRMYATAAARSDGLLLLCGGRDISGTPLADAYGFARHRDGRWEWHAAPGSMPSGRYQHGAVFVGTRLHISGGAVGGGRMVRQK